MPYRRYPSYNRRYGARVGQTTRATPRIYRRPASSLRIPRRIGYSRGRSLKNKILNMQEKKYFDSASTANPDNNGHIVSITDIPQGVTDITRVGDKLVVNSIELGYMLYKDPGTIVDSEWSFLIMNVRIIVFVWYDDTNPTVGNILQMGRTGADAWQNVLSPFEHDKKVKRKILYDKMHTVAPGMVYNPELVNYISQGRANVMKRIFIDLKSKNIAKRTINFEAGGTVGVNKIYVLILAENPSTVSGPVKTNSVLYTRVNFVDG